MATVTVACSINGGLVLGLTSTTPSGAPTLPVVLAGPTMTGGTRGVSSFGLTDIDETFWSNWLAATAIPSQTLPGVNDLFYPNQQVVASNAVWEV